MLDKAIIIEGLKKSYGDILALDSVDLSVDSSEMFGIIGPDGSGKTTLMRILTTLIDADKGDAKVLGFSVKTDAKKIRESIGYMPQRFSLYPDLTVAENMDFFSKLFKVPKNIRSKKKEELLEFSRLKPFVKRRADKLSGGMKQKLALSCALIHTPAILFLDEPTTGVDPVSRREFWSLLAKLKKDGVTIFVSTPYMDEANRCDRIAFIFKGKILAVGTPSEVTKLFPGKVFSISGTDLPAIAASVKRQIGSERVQILGNEIHVSLIENDEKNIDTLLNTLKNDGFKAVKAEETTPTLEDCFIMLMSKV
ncbi:ABC transporter ATP-binding protein [bacterium]|nr:ABC transporter ATP-binding protein [bacterium]